MFISFNNFYDIRKFRPTICKTLKKTKFGFLVKGNYTARLCFIILKTLKAKTVPLISFYINKNNDYDIVYRECVNHSPYLFTIKYTEVQIKYISY